MSNGERTEEEVRRNARTIWDFLAREGIGWEDSAGAPITEAQIVGLLERAVRKVMQENYPRKPKTDMQDIERRLRIVENVIRHIALDDRNFGRR